MAWALGYACLLVGKNNALRIDPPEPDAPVELDDTPRALCGIPC
jgi:hypothetical protein